MSSDGAPLLLPPDAGASLAPSLAADPASATNPPPAIESSSSSSAAAAAAAATIADATATDDASVAAADAATADDTAPASTEASASHDAEHSDANVDESASNATASGTLPGVQGGADGQPIAYYDIVVLRGTYSEQGMWKGHWAMNETEYESPTGLRQEFAYKISKKPAPLRPADAVPHAPLDVYISGYFNFMKFGKQAKCQEHDILLQFGPSDRNGEYAVSGAGRNLFGWFHLRGSFVPFTRALNVERCYYQGATAKLASAKKKGGRVPAFSAAHSPVAPEKPPHRVRRTPSHFADSQVDLTPSVLLTDFSAITVAVNKVAAGDTNGFFMVPVDPVKFNLPTYTSIVTNPMDLGTVQAKLARREYTTIADVAADVRLAFNNAAKFNHPDTLVAVEAKRLLKLFEREYAIVNNGGKRQASFGSTGAAGGGEPRKKKAKSSSRPYADLFSSDGEDAAGDDGVDDDGLDDELVFGRSAAPPKSKSRKAPVDEVAALRDKVAAMSEQLRNLQENGAAVAPRLAPAPAAPRPPKKPKPAVQTAAAAAAPLQASTVIHYTSDDRPPLSAASSSSMAVGVERVLSYQEKRALGQDINKLPADKVQHVVDIINESGCQMGGDDDEVEIDIEKLDTATLRTLQKFVREVLRNEKKKAVRDAAFQ